jgi:hypothetical protein
MADIFVFGSNLVGIHGAGAALTAREKYGAIIGIGEGRTGNAYAIPTKISPTRATRQRSLESIQVSVTRFLEYARTYSEDRFLVTQVGCGLAGYTHAEMAPMFAGASSNVILPKEWLAL